MEKVQELITEIRKGQLQLPEFQRGYVWSTDKVRAFVESLYRGHPTGHLLLWHAYRPVAVKGSTASQPGNSRLLLDGQQRLTSLYVLFEGKKPPFYEGEDLFFNLYFNIQTEEFHFYQKGLMANNPAWRGVHQLFKDGINGVLARIPKMEPAERQVVQDHLARLGQLDSIRNHLYQVDELKDDTLEIDDVVEIFNRVNSAGTPLSRADLAMAHVCIKWPQARHELGQFAAAMAIHGFRIEPEYLIRAIAGATGETVNFTPTFNRIPAEKFIEAWPKVRASYEYLVNILRDHAFVDRISDLPTPLVVVPLLVYLARKNSTFGSAQERDRFIRWMFLANIWSRYAGQTDTRLQRDVYALAGDNPTEKLIEGILSDRGRIELEPKDLEGKGPQTAIYKFSYILARAQEAQDWFTGTTLYSKAIGKSNGLESHHIFPKAVLRKNGYGTAELRHLVNEVGNRAFLTRKANRAIAIKYPTNYLSVVEKKFPGALKAQCVPLEPDLWKLTHYRQFLYQRRKLLAKAMNRFLKRLAHGQPDFSTTNVSLLLGQEEGLQLEFKSSLRWDIVGNAVNRDLEKAIVKTVAGFLNRHGGVLLIGVTDDRQVLGLEADYQSLKKTGRDPRDNFLQHLTNVLSSGLGEAAVGLVTQTCHEVHGKDVCQVVIWQSPHPVYVTEGQASTFYLRIGNLTRAIPLEEVVRYVESRWGSGPADYLPELPDESAPSDGGLGGSLDGWIEGLSAFEQALEFAEFGKQSELERLLHWVVDLRQQGLVATIWSHGGSRPRLLPVPKGESVGLVNILDDGSISLYRSVFERCAPNSIPHIEALTLPVPLGQGHSVRKVSDELLAALTQAYKEAAGTSDA
jgi:hypothetical protein